MSDEEAPMQENEEDQQHFEIPSQLIIMPPTQPAVKEKKASLTLKKFHT
jgi:hypothetical protein